LIDAAAGELRAVIAGIADAVEALRWEWYVLDHVVHEADSSVCVGNFEIAMTLFCERDELLTDVDGGA
jgi:hypothetical protein